MKGLMNSPWKASYNSYVCFLWDVYGLRILKFAFYDVCVVYHSTYELLLYNTLLTFCVRAAGLKDWKLVNLNIMITCISTFVTNFLRLIKTYFFRLRKTLMPTGQTTQNRKIIEIPIRAKLPKWQKRLPIRVWCSPC